MTLSVAAQGLATIRELLKAYQICRYCSATTASPHITVPVRKLDTCASLPFVHLGIPISYLVTFLCHYCGLDATARDWTQLFTPPLSGNVFGSMIS